LAWADQKGQGGMRLAVKQFAHQPRAQKTGCTSNKNEFFVLQSGYNLSALEHFQLKSQQNSPCPIHCAHFAQWVGEHRSLGER